MKHNHAHQINLMGLLDFHGIEEAKQIRRAVTIGCIVNVLLLILKLVFGYCGHSEALVADGFHSFGDVGTDLVMLTFVGLQRNDFQRMASPQRCFCIFGDFSRRFLCPFPW